MKTDKDQADEKRWAKDLLKKTPKPPKEVADKLKKIGEEK